MNKEELQQRIKNINDEMSAMRQNYAKLEGHLAENLHWLKQLEDADQKQLSEEYVMAGGAE